MRTKMIQSIAVIGMLAIAIANTTGFRLVSYSYICPAVCPHATVSGAAEEQRAGTG